VFDAYGTVFDVIASLAELPALIRRPLS